jgi:hypothetical protein
MPSQSTLPAAVPLTAVKLACIAAHAKDLLGSNGHRYDASALQSLLNDPDVVEYLAVLRPKGLLPVPRQPTEAE